jgi:hypothetical protein
MASILLPRPEIRITMLLMVGIVTAARDQIDEKSAKMQLRAGKCY